MSALEWINGEAYRKLQCSYCREIKAIPADEKTYANEEGLQRDSTMVYCDGPICIECYDKRFGEILEETATT